MKKTRSLYFIVLLMFSTAAVTAQNTVLSATGWTVAGLLPPAKNQQNALGVAGPVAGVHNQVLLVAGGANFPEGMPWLGGKKKYYTEGVVFRKEGPDSLVQTASFSLPFTLGYSANCSTPEGIVAAGGENEGGLRDDVLLLQWNETARSVTIKHLPSLPFAVSNAAIAFHQNKLYLAGGERAGDVSAGLLMLDLSDTASGWKSLPSLPHPVSHAVMVVQTHGEEGLYLVGGRKRNPGGRSELFASVYRYELTKGTWRAKKPLPYAVSAGTGVAAGAHSILLFGGDTGETFHKAEDLIAAIAKETDEDRKRQLNEEKTAVQAGHPGFCRQVLRYDTQKNAWFPQDCMPFAAPATTTAFVWEDHVFIPSGEIKAGVRTPHILQARLSSAQKESEQNNR